MGKQLEDDLKRDKPRYPKQQLKLTIPIAPSVNHMYYTTKNGVRRLTSKAERYFYNCKQYVKTEIANQEWVQDKEHVWYDVQCDFYMEDRRTRDTHNMFKIVLDVLEGIVFTNDYFAKPHVNQVELDRENPRIEITIQASKYIKRG